MSALWHGFTDLDAVQREGAFIISRGEGAYIYDNSGNRYLDATAGLWFANVGHGRREIANAVAAQLGRIAHYSSSGDYAGEITLELASRIAELAPVKDSRVFFTSGGSDSIDTATKLARRYWHEMGKPDKRIIVGREFAFHGMNIGGTALAGITKIREGYGDLMVDARTVEWDDAKALLRLIESVGADNIAAFFCEPILGLGGILLPPDGYLNEVRRICRENDILFVVDEIITGFGRIGGYWFASTRFDLDPDLVACAKGLTSGYAPMGAVIIAPHIAEPFLRGGVFWWHGYTFAGHCGAAAAAMANLDIIEREDLLGVAKRLESTLHDQLAPLAEHPRVASVRSGLAALAAVQLTDPSEAPVLVKHLRGQGVSTRAIGTGAIQVSPPLIISDDQVAEFITAFERAVGRLDRGRRGSSS
ncbi:aspartate aminotransferase family protein [Nocardia iowensis]|uniref:Aminotransferase class III-fold pyridoxal phosphate-dependent enzyme n=1 Tax=Nocardia iowensis TaxID=204891 RepID=A0ABX8RYI1_NOCIO|nr:aminotransferase class III-fold pyridoxal phosphate-dependent enzyme [Nocardia iowensis]QXN94702.1 aminotransferase class III-fold pyridoxal phosphate-dependent enzyme [Nocardia iowensis]